MTLGLSPTLYVRQGTAIVEAQQSDQLVARGYPKWAHKGKLTNGQRLTIMTSGSAFSVGEEVRVIHVHEITVSGRELFVMGPKRVYCEILDGTEVAPLPAGVDPLSPAIYNGRVLPSPGIDFNFEITTYRFFEPGRSHRIVWKLGELVSNTLVIETTE